MCFCLFLYWKKLDEKKSKKKNALEKKIVFSFVFISFWSKKYLLNISRLILVDFSFFHIWDKNFASTMWLDETISVCVDQDNWSSIQISSVFFLFQHYEIIREVGKGAFATVHEVRRKNDGFRAACKMVMISHWRRDHFLSLSFCFRVDRSKKTWTGQ